MKNKKQEETSLEMQAEKKRVYRHELKYLINEADKELIKMSLGELLQLDKHAVNGYYTIRSLYFDDYFNRAYDEKMLGVNARKKYRIRIYNFSDKAIQLERKIKVGQHILKESAKLTRDEVYSILDGDYEFLLQRKENFCKEFYYECISNVMRPKVIVDYDREPFILEAGTVRITFDLNVRAAALSFDIFDGKLPTFETLEDGELIMEVKFTEFMPGYLNRIIQPNAQKYVAVSKYVLCYDRMNHLLIGAN